MKLHDTESFLSSLEHWHLQLEQFLFYPNDNMWQNQNEYSIKIIYMKWPCVHHSTI